MRLPIDSTSMKFLAASAAEPVVDFDTKRPKADADGQPLFSVRLVAISGGESEIVAVKVAGQVAALGAGDFVNVRGLVAQPWSNNGRSGISFRADRIEVAAKLAKAS